MKVICKTTGEIFSGIIKIEILHQNGFITFDNVTITPPITIEAQEYTGFFALEDLMSMFKHMKCWTEHDGSECPACPVKHDGVCGLMGIRDAAEKEMTEKAINHE
jgi:hypothetical protein